MQVAITQFLNRNIGIQRPWRLYTQSGECEAATKTKKTINQEFNIRQLSFKY